MRNRKAYVKEVKLRWDGEPLRDAVSNWRLFEEHHGEISEFVRMYLRDPFCADLSGKSHNPEGTLTSWFWKLSDANPFIWDFCEHYQTCHLRRGIIQYAKQIIAELKGEGGGVRRVCGEELF